MLKSMRLRLQEHIRTFPGHDFIVDENGWIIKDPVQLPDDPDAGLIVQDPPCFLDRLNIPGYTDATSESQHGAGADFDPLEAADRNR